MGGKVGEGNCYHNELSIEPVLLKLLFFNRLRFNSANFFFKGKAVTKRANTTVGSVLCSANDYVLLTLLSVGLGVWTSSFRDGIMPNCSLIGIFNLYICSVSD